MKQNKKKYIRSMLIIGTIALFIYFFKMLNIDIPKLIQTLKQAHFFLLIAIIITWIESFLRIFRYGSILKFYNYRISFKTLFVTYFVGLFTGSLTPMKAGEPIKAVILKKKSNVPLTIGVMSSMIERIFELAIMALLLLISIGFNNTLNLSVRSFYLIASVYLSLFLTLFIVVLGYKIEFFYRLLEIISLKIKFRILSKILNSFQRFILSLKEKTFSQRIIFSLNILIQSFLIIIIDAFIFYFVFKAFNWSVSVFVIIGVIIMASLAGVLSQTPGGVVTTEGILIYLFSLFQIPIEICTATSLITRAIGFYFFMIIGFLFSIEEGVNF